MAKASDNEFPSILFVEGGAPTTPASGNQRLFVDSADGHLKRVDDTGTVTDTETGGGGGGGSASGEYDWNYYPYWDRFNAATLETRVAGTYGYTNTNITGSGFIYNSSAAVNDTIDFNVWLGPGTYDLYVVGGTDGNRGITTISLDDGAGTFTSLGTMDWFGSSANDIGKSITGIVVTGSVVRRKLRAKVTSKNGSSTGFFMSLQQLRLIRTA